MMRPNHECCCSIAGLQELYRRNCTVPEARRQGNRTKELLVWSHHCCVCVCVLVICTFRGGSLCSVGLDASFGSGLLRPLCDVVSLPSAESEPLYFAG